MTDDLREEIEALRAQLRRLERRVASLEEAAGVETEVVDREVPASESSGMEEAATEADDAAPADASVEETAEFDGDDAAGSPTAISLPRFDADAAVTWLGRVGVLALVIGIGLFIRYAIERGLIGYLGRVLLGVTAGLALIAAGTYATRTSRYERWGALVTAGGIAITYFSVYASYHFPDYRDAIGISLSINLAALTLIVAGAIGLSLALDRRGIAGGAFLLGYVTAWLSAEFGALTLAYALLLTIGVTIVVSERAWPELLAGSLLGTYAIYLAWLGGVDDPFLPGAPALVAAFASFLTAMAWRPAPTGERLWADRAETAVPSVGNALAFAALFDRSLPDVDPVVRAAFYAGLVACYAGRYALDRGALERNAPFSIRHDPAAPYLSVLFALVAAVVSLELLGITVAWAVIALVLIELAIRFDLDPPRYAAHGVVVLLVPKVAIVDAIELAGFAANAPLGSTRPAAFLVAVVACSLVSIRFGRWRDAESETVRGELLSASTAYAWAATALLVGLIGLELDGAWITVAWAALVSTLAWLSFRFDRLGLRVGAHAVATLLAAKVALVDATELAGLAADEPLAASRPLAFLVTVATFGFLYAWFDRRRSDLSPPERKRPVAVPVPYAWAATILLVTLVGLEFEGARISVAWAVLGLLLLLGGIRLDARELRLQSIVLFVITTAKVFLVDTADLGPVARTVSFLALGAILVLASLIYARYRNELGNVV